MSENEDRRETELEWLRREHEQHTKENRTLLDARVFPRSLPRYGPIHMPQTAREVPGEGFDHASLDTLFLAFPVSWKGIVQQYVGRIHRRHADKHEVRVYDYARNDSPTNLARFRAVATLSLRIGQNLCQ